VLWELPGGASKYLVLTDTRTRRPLTPTFKDPCFERPWHTSPRSGRSLPGPTKEDWLPDLPAGQHKGGGTESATQHGLEVGCPSPDASGNRSPFPQTLLDMETSTGVDRHSLETISIPYGH
jgi:hypothetical protein